MRIVVMKQEKPETTEAKPHRRGAGSQLPSSFWFLYNRRLAIHMVWYLFCLKKKSKKKKILNNKERKNQK